MTFIVVLLHALGAAGILFSPLPINLKLVGLCILILSLLHALWRSPQLNYRGGQPHWRPYRLYLASDGHVEVRNKEGVGVATHVHSSSSILPGLVVLHLRGEKNKHRETFLFCNDNLSKQQFRRLKVWLRFIGAQPKASSKGDVFFEK